MHPEILSKQQQELLQVIKKFRRNFYLVGGTAIALQIGHRQSIDFDLFSNNSLKKRTIHGKLDESKHHRKLIFESNNQIHFLMNSVKLTFFHYPFEIIPDLDFNGIIKLPSLLDLAAMKTLALGGRAKWKDYVDLYFLFKDYFTLKQISHHALKLFGEARFSSKLFREQLAYYKDINYEEEVIFLPGFKVSDAEIKKFLTEIALQ